MAMEFAATASWADDSYDSRIRWPGRSEVPSDWKPAPRAGREHGMRSAKATLAGIAARGSGTGPPPTGAVGATARRTHKTMFEASRPSRDTVKLSARSAADRLWAWQ